MQCKAQRKHGAGPCTRHAIEGGTVCAVHGGSAPQVKRAARERILDLVDPALAVLSRAMRLKPQEKASAVALAAARDILDRAGHKAIDKIQLSGEITTVTAADMLKAELDELHKRIADGANSRAPRILTNGSPQPPT